jgi:ribokinase
MTGAILHAGDNFEVAAGGGAVTAAGLAELAGSCLFLTAVGDDERGVHAVHQLRSRDLEVHAARRPRPTRRVVTFLDDAAERTIVILGDRLVPHAVEDHELPWDRCAELDGVFFSAGDGAAAVAARGAGVLVATPRATEALQGVRCDALVYSANDPDEVAWARELDADVHVLTEGMLGGHWIARDGTTGRWNPVGAAGPPVDSYGCGDHFVAGLTFGLASGLELGAAIALAAGRVGVDAPRALRQHAAQRVVGALAPLGLDDLAPPASARPRFRGCVTAQVDAAVRA